LNCPDFSYRRLYLASQTIDSNVMKARALDGLCRSSAIWAYPLYRPRIVAEFTAIAHDTLSDWLMKIGAQIESRPACRFRKLRHIQDGQSLLKAVERYGTVEPGIGRYLMIEAAFLMPLIFLNSRFMVPFRNGAPWTEAVQAASAADVASCRQYRSLIATIARSNLFRELNRNGSFGSELKRERSQCRTMIIDRFGEIFSDGYGALIGPLISECAELKQGFLRRMANGTENYNELAVAMWQWMSRVQGLRLRQPRLPAIPELIVTR
jgi:hypothetical protein